MKSAHRTGFVLFIVGTLLLLTGVVTAQPNTVNYGDTVLAEISDTQPQTFYSFNATPGDIVMIRAVGLDPNMVLSLSLNSGIGQQLAFGFGEPPASNEVFISARIEESGAHLLLVGIMPGSSTGRILLSIDGHTPSFSAPLTSAPVEVPLDPAQGPLAFTFDADLFENRTLCIQALDFSAQLIAQNGQQVATLGGGLLHSAALTIAPGEESFDLLVFAGENLELAQIVYSPPGVGCADAAPSSSSDTSSVPAPPVSAATPQAPQEVCVIAGDGVHVRQGPGPDYDIIGSLFGTLMADGVTSNGWYRVEYASQTGYIAQDVVTTSAGCVNLATVQGPPPGTPGTGTPTGTTTGTPYTETPTTATPMVTPTPSNTPDPAHSPTPTYTPSSTYTPTMTYTATFTPPPGATATYTYTPTHTPPVNTATYTPSYTPTHTPPANTATFTPSYTPTTPPPPPTAPEDARFNDPLTIPLDSTVSTTDFVSYPDGDTEDRVRYSVTGMNPNAALSGGRAQLTIAVSCFGTGTANIEFFTGGQTFSCGQTIVDREVTADSNTGSIIITAVSGTNTYVQWVLTGTATRLN
ncbi:MAG: SH3 domain-containing protein [Chloroflexota bacterium]